MAACCFNRVALFFNILTIKRTMSGRRKLHILRLRSTPRVPVGRLAPLDGQVGRRPAGGEDNCCEPSPTQAMSIPAG
jgi:hypothetical protein